VQCGEQEQKGGRPHKLQMIPKPEHRMLGCEDDLADGACIFSKGHDRDKENIIGRRKERMKRKEKHKNTKTQK